MKELDLRKARYAKQIGATPYFIYKDGGDEYVVFRDYINGNKKVIAHREDGTVELNFNNKRTFITPSIEYYKALRLEGKYNNRKGLDSLGLKHYEVTNSGEIFHKSRPETRLVHRNMVYNINDIPINGPEIAVHLFYGMVEIVKMKSTFKLILSERVKECWSNDTHKQRIYRKDFAYVRKSLLGVVNKILIIKKGNEEVTKYVLIDNHTIGNERWVRDEEQHNPFWSRYFLYDSVKDEIAEREEQENGDQIFTVKEYYGGAYQDMEVKLSSILSDNPKMFVKE
jgi:hypothetical protein